MDSTNRISPAGGSPPPFTVPSDSSDDERMERIEQTAKRALDESTDDDLRLPKLPRRVALPSSSVFTCEMTEELIALYKGKFDDLDNATFEVEDFYELPPFCNLPAYLRTRSNVLAFLIEFQFFYYSNEAEAEDISTAWLEETLFGDEVEILGALLALSEDLARQSGWDPLREALGNAYQALGIEVRTTRPSILPQYSIEDQRKWWACIRSCLEFIPNNSPNIFPMYLGLLLPEASRHVKDNPHVTEVIIKLLNNLFSANNIHLCPFIINRKNESLLWSITEQWFKLYPSNASYLNKEHPSYLLRQLAENETLPSVPAQDSHAMGLMLSRILHAAGEGEIKSIVHFMNKKDFVEQILNVLLADFHAHSSKPDNQLLEAELLFAFATINPLDEHIWKKVRESAQKLFEGDFAFLLKYLIFLKEFTKDHFRHRAIGLEHLQQFRLLSLQIFKDLVAIQQYPKIVVTGIYGTQKSFEERGTSARGLLRLKILNYLVKINSGTILLLTILKTTCRHFQERIF